MAFVPFSAESKEEFKNLCPQFVDPTIGEKSIIFEVFTNYEEESEALKIISNVERTASSEAKDAVKKILGEKGTKAIKKILR